MKSKIMFLIMLLSVAMLGTSCNEEAPLSDVLSTQSAQTGENDNDDNDGESLGDELDSMEIKSVSFCVKGHGPIVIKLEEEQTLDNFLTADQNGELTFVIDENDCDPKFPFKVDGDEMDEEGGTTNLTVVVRSSHIDDVLDGIVDALNAEEESYDESDDKEDN